MDDLLLQSALVNDEEMDVLDEEEEVGMAAAAASLLAGVELARLDRI